MSAKQKEPLSIIPLTAPVFHILLALADRQRHGYAILKEVEARSRGEVQLSTGTLYAAIKRLLTDGLIEEADTRPSPAEDDDRRRYYRLTSLGRRVAQAEAERLMKLIGIANQKLALPPMNLVAPGNQP